MLPAFLIASIVLLATPGPDVLFVVSTGLAEGRRVALWSAVGISSAMLVHAVIAAVGVGALVAGSELFFNALRIAGGGYLLYLAFRAFTARPHELVLEGAVPRSATESARRGFLTNLLNPKAIVFSALFLPQFTSPTIGPIGVQMVVLGALLALMGLAFQATLALGSSGMGRWLVSSPKRRITMERVTGVVFVALALRIFTLQRQAT